MFNILDFVFFALAATEPEVVSEYMKMVYDKKNGEFSHSDDNEIFHKKIESQSLNQMFNGGNHKNP